MTALGFWETLGAGGGDYPTALSGLVVVEAGYQVLTVGTYGLQITWRYGIDAGSPYFNTTGVASGDEAVLAMDPDTGTHYLVPVTVV